MHQEPADPGGGGVNVARVLHELAATVPARPNPRAGASGRVLEESLDEAGVPRRSVLIRGQTRVSPPYRTVRVVWNIVSSRRPDTERDRISGLPGGGRAGARRVADRQRQPAARRSGRRLCADRTYRGTHGAALEADTSGCRAGRGARAGRMRTRQASLSELEFLAGRELSCPEDEDRQAMALVRRGAARMVAVTLGAGGAFAGHRGRRDPGAGHGGGDAQFGRRGRCVPRGGGPRAGTWSLAGTCAGLGHRGRSDCHRVCRHSQAVAGRCGGPVSVAVRRRLARLRGLEGFSSARSLPINGLTEKVFTTEVSRT